MRNTWLVIKREYLEKVRTKAFILSTILMPVFIFAISVLPSMMMMKSAGTRTIEVIAADTALAKAVQDRILDMNGKPPEEEKTQLAKKSNPAPAYRVRVSSDFSDARRKALNEEIKAGTLDGYLWLTKEAVSSRKVDYITKNPGDVVALGGLGGALRAALTRNDLAAVGVTGEKAESILRWVDINAKKYDADPNKQGNPMLAFLLPIALMMTIYMTVLIYGMAVMRAVMEEKTSRVMEVLLSSLKSSELMAGKILGVGAVGLTQMLIWTSLGAVAGTGVIGALKPFMKDVALPLPVLLYFPVFFLLGYLIYSTMFAAVGAMVNSQEEAQQFVLPVMMPLIACMVICASIISQPDGTLAVVMSLFPLTAPIVMYTRIAITMPPWQQIVGSIVLQVITLWGLIIVCARIYRVGILMYGKRPTLPEILKWLKYS